MSVPQNVHFHYKNIERLVDRLIARHGSELTCAILEAELAKTSAGKDADVIINNFIINAGIEVFGISQKQIKLGKSAGAKCARWSFFYLIRKHTNLSDQWIANYFGEATRGPVQYGDKKITDLLSTPKIDIDHYTKHCELQTRVIDFIDKNSK